MTLKNKILNLNLNVLWNQFIYIYIYIYYIYITYNNHDIECSNHHPFLSALRPKGLSRTKTKWWAIVIVRLPHPWSGNSQGQETFWAPSADKQTRNYDINHHPTLSVLRPKGLSCSKMKWWAIYIKKEMILY